MPELAFDLSQKYGLANYDQKPDNVLISLHLLILLEHKVLQEAIQFLRDFFLVRHSPLSPQNTIGRSKCCILFTYEQPHHPS